MRTPPWARCELEALDRLNAVRDMLDHLLAGGVERDAEPAVVGDLADMMRTAERWLRLSRESQAWAASSGAA